MKIIRHPKELGQAGRKVCLAIGVFDGVHLGHQQVIRQAIADAARDGAEAVVITFDKHPSSVVAPERTPPLLYSLPQKLRALASLGCDTTLLVPFTREFSQQTGEAFIRKLAGDFGQILSVCVGSAFAFGHKKSGNVALLERLGKELNYTVHGLEAVASDGETVSSTRIRQTVRDGRLDEAGRMLGRPYALCGNVEQGDQLGRKLGFPTANVDAAGLALPPSGVYAARVEVDGTALNAVVNIGVRPTLQNPAPQLRVEAHLLDFAGDLYGRELELTLLGRIRPEIAFASLGDLQQQIRADIGRARTMFPAVSAR